MFNKLLSSLGFQRKESRAYSALIQLGLDMPVWTPRDYEHLTHVGYQLNADVYACVNLIARSAKQVPWLVYKHQGATEVSVNHPLLTLLNKPNERDTGSDLVESAIAYLLLSGNAYLERSGGNEKTPPAFIYSHRPDRMKVIKGNRRLIIAGYEYKAAGPPVHFDEWEILHLKLFNPLDDWYGMSPIEAAAYTIDCSNESAKLYKRLLQKGYPPGAVMIKGADYVDTQIQDLKAGLKRASENGDILLLQDATWQEMGFKPVDASLFEGKLFNKRDIAACYGVPSGMIGDTQVKTYANSREERRSLYTEAVIPALTKLRDGLNNWLGPLFNGAYIDIDKDAIDALAEDRETQAKRVVALFEKGLIKRNEGRAELKYDAVPEDEDGYFNEVAKPASGLSLPPGSEDRGPAPAPGTNRLTDNSSDADQRQRRKPIAIDSRRSDPGYQRQYKVFNLLSEQERETAWKEIEDRRADWDSSVTENVKDRFHDEQQLVIRAFRDGGQTGALKAVSAQEENWVKLYKSTVFAVAEDFGRRTLLSIKSSGYEEMEVKFELDLFTRTLLHWLSTEGAKRVVGILDVTKEKIRTELAAGVAAGEGTFPQAKRLEAMYQDFGYVRAERIARTEVHGAASLGSQTAARATNLPLVKEWLATMDKRTRDTHAFGHGQRQLMKDPYIIGGSKMMHPGDSTLGAPASEIIQCFPEDTLVVAENVEKAFRRFYVGDLVEITDSLGNKLSGTPNHPVLTTAGWRPLNAIKKGDQIICSVLGNSASGSDPDIETSPTRIGEIYDALANSGNVQRTSGRDVDFHGDGSNRDVEIVFADSLLLCAGKASASQHVDNLSLPRADFAQPALVAQGQIGQRSMASFAATASAISGSSQAPSLLGGRLLHSFGHSAATSAGFNPGDAEQSRRDAARDTQAGGNGLLRLPGLISADDLGRDIGVIVGIGSGNGNRQGTSANVTALQVALNGSNAATEMRGDTGIAHARKVQIADIVDVRLRSFEGHVYNLETASHWYMSETIITRNCRCAETYSVQR